MRLVLLDLLARLNRWPRRLAALGCVLLAGASALAARRSDSVHPPGPSGIRVVVAAHDLGAAAILADHDLAIASWPRDLVPAGVAADPHRLVGRRLAGPLRKLEAVTTTRLVGADLTAALAVGQVATAVSIDAALATLLHAGDRVDILAGPPTDVGAIPEAGKGTAGAVVIAAAARVLAVLPSTAVDAPSGSTPILVVTDRGTAVRIVALQGRGVLAVVLSPP